MLPEAQRSFSAITHKCEFPRLGGNQILLIYERRQDFIVLRGIILCIFFEDMMQIVQRRLSEIFLEE